MQIFLEAWGNIFRYLELVTMWKTNSCCVVGAALLKSCVSCVFSFVIPDEVIHPAVLSFGGIQSGLCSSRAAAPVQTAGGQVWYTETHTKQEIRDCPCKVKLWFFLMIHWALLSFCWHSCAIINACYELDISLFVLYHPASSYQSCLDKLLWSSSFFLLLVYLYSCNF